MTARNASRYLASSHPLAGLWARIALAALLVPFVAGAESSGPPPGPSTAIVRIDAAAVAPLALPVASGQRVAFRNDSPAMARVELDLARGEGVACATPGETPRKARKFVVPGGATLDCDAPAESVDWHVYRAGAPESEGRLEIGAR